MSVCTFFGHRDCPESILPKLKETVNALICDHAVDRFLVGNQGNFDSYALRTLEELQRIYPQIQYAVVLAYLPQQAASAPDNAHSIYPEGIELCPKRFCISWRNRWMLQKSDYVVAYVAHPSGGAAQAVASAERQKKHVFNLTVPE